MFPLVGQFIVFPPAFWPLALALGAGGRAALAILVIGATAMNSPSALIAVNALNLICLPLKSGV